MRCIVHNEASGFFAGPRGRGWTKASSPMRIELADSYGQFANIHLSQSGVVR